MKLSLCAIVKNDELLVRKMLDSAIDIVDEVVIADTGSTDSTWDVLEKFQEEYPDKVKLLRFEWVNDFSAARNFTLDHASGDWILVVDADEFLDANEKMGLRAFLETTSAEGVLITQRNYTGSMKQFGSVLDVDTVRVFRAHHRYDLPIHEQIVTSIERAKGTFDRYALHLHHVGYTDEYSRLKKKNERNLELLEKQYASMGNDDPNMRWFVAGNLMAEYNATGEFEKIRTLSRKVLDEIEKTRWKAPPIFYPRIYKFRISALFGLGELDLALLESKKAVQKIPNNADLWLNLSEVFMQKGLYREALKSLAKTRSITTPQHSVIEYNEGSQTYLASARMAECWFRLGDDLAAREWYVRSYTENQEQKGIIPMIALLSQEPQILREMWPLARTEGRVIEWLDSYSVYETGDLLDYVAEAEHRYGVSNVTKRARAAYAVRTGRSFSLPQHPEELDHLRLFLYLYEKGEKTKAVKCLERAGDVGATLKQVMSTCAGTSPTNSWNTGNLLQEFLSMRSVCFLRDHVHAMADLKRVFPYLLHTDLLPAFTSAEYLEKDGSCPEEWEWQAQVYQALGKPKAAEDKLSMALLADGHYSVRGYSMFVSLHPDDEQKYIAEARKIYPTSKTIRMRWSAQFADRIRRVM